ncbi:hypothetical protein [Goodfellowiella coeruleoviolacea]|uniref:Uncharacterized protein n=1 Tax=Goodfellowiella coeruleoviolacea TaxID=334858 RepID=A0AAE3KGX1_9PSEU|nr:hypothetical protein [Goodfellowiella coeruleoviolacea]MCP2166297.1 hypothetical protein [Goodfellowiella coeruleoviolacea]
MGFNVTCTPGRDAAAGMVHITEELPALVVYLDPVNVAIQIPPQPGGAASLARFCRELARESLKLAEYLLGHDDGRHALGGQPDEQPAGSPDRQQQ